MYMPLIDKVFTLLKEVNEELSVTIITVSHDPKFLQHCRRGVIIVDGRVTAQGPAASWGGGAG